MRGIRGKIDSIQGAVDYHKSHLAVIVKTKGKPAKLDGYKWENKLNKQATKGGISIAVKEELMKSTKVLPNDESEIDTMWIEIATNNSKLHIGAFYGKQENAPKEECELEFAQLTTQIKRLQTKGEVILTGDFNAKLEIKKGIISQEESTRGTLLKQLLKETDMIPVSIENANGDYTRVNRNKLSEKSIIDYILMTRRIAEKATDTNIDEVGIMRIKGKKESDHNTMTTSVRTKWENTVENKKVWNIKNKEGWKKFNPEIKKLIAKNPNNNNYDETERIIHTAMHHSIGKITRVEGQTRKKDTKVIKNIRKQKK